MKFEITADKIKGIFTQASRLTGKNPTLPILETVLCIVADNTLKIRATNLSLGAEFSIPVKTEQEGVFAIRADVVNQFIQTISKDEKISFSLEGDVLTLTTKHTTASLKTYQNDDFPTIPLVSGSGIVLPIKTLLQGVSSVLFSASTSDIKPEIGSIYIYNDESTLTFVATDTFRLAEKKVKIKNTESLSLLIPLKNVLEIKSILENYSGDIEVIFTKHQVSFLFEGVHITSRLIDGIFPDYHQIFPKENNLEITFLKEEMANALKTTNIFSDKFNKVSLSIAPKEKNIVLETKNTDVGENKTTISCSGSGEKTVYMLNSRHLLEVIPIIQGSSVTLSGTDAHRPIVIQGIDDKNFLYLIMPLSL